MTVFLYMNKFPILPELRRFIYVYRSALPSSYESKFLRLATESRLNLLKLRKSRRLICKDLKIFQF